MGEEKPKEDPPKEDPPKEDPPKEDPPKEDPAEEKDLVGEANKAAERLEKANEEQKKLLDRQEKLAANARLGGKAAAGAPPQEETPKEYAEKVMRGDV
jgi:hypothetical protein